MEWYGAFGRSNRIQWLHQLSALDSEQPESGEQKLKVKWNEANRERERTEKNVTKWKSWNLDPRGTKVTKTGKKSANQKCNQGNLMENEKDMCRI